MMKILLLILLTGLLSSCTMGTQMSEANRQKIITKARTYCLCHKGIFKITFYMISADYYCMDTKINGKVFLDDESETLFFNTPKCEIK